MNNNKIEVDFISEILDQVKEYLLNKKYPFHFPFNELDNLILSPHRSYSPFNNLLR